MEILEMKYIRLYTTIPQTEMYRSDD